MFCSKKQLICFLFVLNIVKTLSAMKADDPADSLAHLYSLKTAVIPSLITLCIPYVVNRIQADAYSSNSLLVLLEYCQQTNLPSEINNTCKEQLYKTAQEKYKKGICILNAWLHKLGLTAEQEMLFTDYIINNSTIITRLSKQIFSQHCIPKPYKSYDAFVIKPEQPVYVKKRHNKIKLIDCVTQKLVKKFEIDLLSGYFSICPNGIYLATLQQSPGHFNNPITLWDIKTGEKIYTTNLDAWCTAMTLTNDNQLVYSTLADTYLHNFNTHETNHINNRPSSLHALSPDGSMVAIKEYDTDYNKIHIHDFAQKRIIKTFRTHKLLFDFIFCPNTNRLISVENNTICWRDIQTGEYLRCVPQTICTDKLLLSHNGAFLAALSTLRFNENGYTQILENETGNCLMRIPCNVDSAPHSGAFSYDDQRLFVSFPHQLIEYTFFNKKLLENQSVLTLLLLEYMEYQLDRNEIAFLGSEKFKPFLTMLDKALPQEIKTLLQNKIQTIISTKENFSLK